jgi:outer membrane protein W
MKRHIILTVMLAVMLGSVYAQESSEKKEEPSYLPEAGDFTGAILFGRGNFLNSGLVAPPSPSSSSWTIPGSPPINNTVGADNSNSVNNIVGVEARYFFTQKIALKLSGGAIIRNTPAQDNLPGVFNGPNAAWIPAYNAIIADNQSDININIGGEYHFITDNKRLSPYIGLTVPIYYGRRSQYNPTIDDTKQPDDPGYVVDVGVRHAQLVGYGLQAVAGVDYYLMQGFYFGFEIKPISYVYSYTSTIPAPGLEPMKADNHTWSFFAQTFLKIGFKF